MFSQILLDKGASKTAKDVEGNIPRDYVCLLREVDDCSLVTKFQLGLLLNPDDHFY